MPQKAKRATRVTATKAKAKRTHLRPLHMLRLYSFSALAVVLIGIQIVSNLQTQTRSKAEVLAYAQNINTGDLFAATNQARIAHGFGGFTLSGKLSAGAQAKANDMIAKNYWSHNAPDGTQPWSFFTNAGYQYRKAGENLAYGFNSSTQTIEGWMNSPGHKANILGAYQDVGFGIASGPAYQGGENTVVVAFYGVPYAAPAPAPAPAAAAPKPAPVAAAPAPKPAPAPTPAPAPAPTPAPAAAAPAKEAPKAEEPKKEDETPQVAVAPEPKRVTTLESLLTGNATWAMYASMGAMGVTTLSFGATHLKLIRRGWKISRHYILVHPAMDAAVLAALFATLLTSTSGFIK